MKEKIEHAKEIIRMVAEQYRNPIIYTGFGKDSLPLVHLIRSMGLNWEIMFHRDPYFPWKYRFANLMIDKWKLVCRDYPARLCSVFYMSNTYEVARHYAVGYGDVVLCAMLYKPEQFIEGEYLCALKDVYLQPKGGSYDYRWDAGVLGHRYCERKPHRGMQEAHLSWELRQNIGSPDYAYPMLYWTDQENYQYHVDNGIPYNTDVYEVRDGALEPKIDPKTGEIDSTYNPDRRPACFECMKPDNPWSVFCPKKMCFTNNVYNNLVLTRMPEDFLMTHPETKHLFWTDPKGKELKEDHSHGMAST